MEISKRAALSKSSPIRKLIPYAEEAQKRGIKVLFMNIGQPDIETPPEALDVVLNFNEKILAYSPSQGFMSLRNKISEYLQGYGISLSSEHISITTGGSEAILFAFAAVCDPGDNIIVIEPFYANYHVFAMLLGIEVRTVTTSIFDGFHLRPNGKSVEDFRSRIDDRTKAILICNPSNPSGVVYTREEINMICELAIEHDLFIISDEVYREFVFDGLKFTSPAMVEEVGNRVIITDSISKRFSSCGARIGFIASKNADVMNAVYRFSMARLSPPTIGQKLAERAFGIGDDYIERTVEEYRKRRDVLGTHLEGERGIIFSKPEGTFYMIVKLPGIDSEEFAKFLLKDFSIDDETLLIAPASGFYATEGLGKDEIRIAFVLDTERTKRAARILIEGYRSYLKKAGISRSYTVKVDL